MKKLLSIALAAAMLATVSIGAFATDYTEDPGYSDVETPGVGTKEDPVEVPTADVVANAIESGDPIYVKGDTVLTEDVVSTIAEAETNVVFVAESGISITIDPATITEVKDVDLTFTVTAQTGETALTKAPAIKILPSMTGDFGLTVKLTIPAAMIPTGLGAEAAHLLYVGNDGSVKDMGVLTLNADGAYVVPISHASYYLVTSDTSIVTGDDTTGGNQDDNNPVTGVTADSALALAAVASAAIASAAIAFKLKRKN